MTSISTSGGTDARLSRLLLSATSEELVKSLIAFMTCHCFLTVQFQLSLALGASLFWGNQDHQQAHTFPVIFRDIVPQLMLFCTIFHMPQTYKRCH